MDETYDLLIVGAGPTGLMAAIECARYGLSCVIIEEKARRSRASKAIAIQPRTMEIFHFLGLSEKFLQEGQKIHGGNFSTPSGQIARIDFSSLDSPFPFIVSLEQGKTEAILESHLSTLGIEVLKEKKLVKLEEGSEFVTAYIEGMEPVKARFVIGCDGAHSTVRKHLDLPFKGKAFADLFSLADVTIDWKKPHDEVSVVFHPDGPVAVIPLPEKGQYRLIFQLKRCRNVLDKNNLPLDPLAIGSSPPPSFEETEQVMQRFGDKKAKLSQPQWLANFHINSRLVSRYQRGRIFLAGDAAHIHSPIGGQGMNIGLHDAFNFVWKLAFTIKHKASPRLLESYHAERHGVAKDLLSATEGATSIITLHHPLAIYVRNHLAAFFLQRAFVKKQLIKAIAEIGMHYPKSPLIQTIGKFSSGPEAGSRAPDITLKKEGLETSLFEIIKNPKSYFLLLFSGLHPTAEVIENLHSWDFPEIEGPITRLMILHNHEKAGCLVDISGKAHQKYGAEHGAAYLLRPDGYIAMRQSRIK